jgi:hypothetical protein
MFVGLVLIVSTRSWIEAIDEMVSIMGPFVKARARTST